MKSPLISSNRNSSGSNTKRSSSNREEKGRQDAERLRADPEFNQSIKDSESFRARFKKPGYHPLEPPDLVEMSKCTQERIAADKKYYADDRAASLKAHFAKLKAASDKEQADMQKRLAEQKIAQEAARKKAFAEQKAASDKAKKLAEENIRSEEKRLAEKKQAEKREAEKRESERRQAEERNRAEKKQAEERALAQKKALAERKAAVEERQAEQRKLAAQKKAAARAAADAQEAKELADIRAGVGAVVIDDITGENLEAKNKYNFYDEYNPFKVEVRPGAPSWEMIGNPARTIIEGLTPDSVGRAKLKKQEEEEKRLKAAIEGRKEQDMARRLREHEKKWDRIHKEQGW